VRIAVLLAESPDGCGRELAARLAALSGEPCPVIDACLPAGACVGMSERGILWDGLQLERFDRIVVSGFDFQDPLVPRAVASADWSVWQIDYIVDQQRWSFVASVLRDLQRRGVSLVNRWDALQFGFAKARLLAELKRAGFCVPPWLCSSEMGIVQRFCSEHARVVWRPCTGRAMWQLFLDKQREHLVGRGKPPVLLARHPGQGLARAFVCADEVLLALESSAPSQERFERMEEAWACDCGPLAGELVGAARAIGAHWAQLAYVERDGRPCIYDIDTDPRYGWLPGAFRDYLHGRLARKLLELPAPPAEALPVPERGERDSLFVRRMLVTLHELEATKYPRDAAPR
jgi:hypothetical protein